MNKSNNYTFNPIREPYSKSAPRGYAKEKYYHQDGKVIGDVWQMNILGQNDKKEMSQVMPDLFDEFMQYDALGLSNLIKTKQISPAELLEVVIKRIEYFNPKINAVNIKLYERAREAILNTNTNSVFSGVPVLIKDMIDIGGVIRSDGSKLMQNNIPLESVPYS